MDSITRGMRREIHITTKEGSLLFPPILNIEISPRDPACTPAFAADSSPRVIPHFSSQYPYPVRAERLPFLCRYYIYSNRRALYSPAESNNTAGS